MGHRPHMLCSAHVKSHLSYCRHHIERFGLEPWGGMFGTAIQDESHLSRTCQQCDRTYFASLETGSSHTKAIATTSIFCSPLPHPSKAHPLRLILFVALQINF